MSKYHPWFILGYLLWRTGLCNKFVFTRHGVNFNFSRSNLAMNMFIFKDYIKRDISLLDMHLKHGDTFIDIGANIGTWSLYASKKLGTEGKVLTFEPHPQTYGFLKENIGLNKAKNITSFNLGLSEEDGELYFTNTLDTMNHVVSGKSENTISIPVKRLDEFTLDVELIDLLKIDVEGYELPVLKGAKATLLKTRKIIFESNYEFQQKFNYTTSDLILYLQSLGFDIYQLSDNSFQRMIKPDYTSENGEDLIAINQKLA